MAKKAKAYSAAELSAIQGMWGEGMADRAIAEAMSTRFKRKVTANGISQVRGKRGWTNLETKIPKGHSVIIPPPKKKPEGRWSAARFWSLKGRGEESPIVATINELRELADNLERLFNLKG